MLSSLVNKLSRGLIKSERSWGRASGIFEDGVFKTYCSNLSSMFIEALPDDPRLEPFLYGEPDKYFNLVDIKLHRQGFAVEDFHLDSTKIYLLSGKLVAPNGVTLSVSNILVKGCGVDFDAEAKCYPYFLVGERNISYRIIGAAPSQRMAFDEVLVQIDILSRMLMVLEADENKPQTLECWEESEFKSFLNSMPQFVLTSLDWALRPCNKRMLKALIVEKAAKMTSGETILNPKILRNNLKFF